MSESVTRAATAPDDDLRAAARAGLVAMAPIMLGVVPFGLVAGVAAVDAGLGVAGAMAFSLVVFAGASQLAAITLVGAGAPALVALLTGIVINLRMVMYSASLAPEVAELPRRWRLLGAYVLTDQAYAVTMADVVERPRRTQRARFVLYASAAWSMWLLWQVCTLVGAVAGGVVPESVPLGFAVPLAFLSLLVPAVRDRPTAVAAVVAGVVATLGVTLPNNLGMPVAAVLGVAAGWAVQHHARDPVVSDQVSP